MNKKLANVFVFSILFALAVNAVDIIYHLSTGVLAPLYYIIRKFLAMFVAAFAVTWLYGKNIKSGVAVSVLGPVLFFIYYRFFYLIKAGDFFAFGPEVGDSVSMLFAHMIMAFAVYWMFLKVVKE